MLGKGRLPVRMCSVCRNRMPKPALLRYVIASEGASPMPDQEQRASGRGVYVCDNESCREAFLRRCAKRKVKG